MKIKIILIVLLCSINVANGNTLSGKVVGVADGDTITVLDEHNTQHRIRLAGIDAPEKKQDFGNVSKQTLSNMVFNENVEINWDKEDRYGRIIGKVLVNGVDVNLKQIKLGMAWFYRKYQNELILEDRLNYLHAEEYALNNKVGLWQLKNPEAPWDFRKQRH
jgi:endonuclease YncB( thermonuclease family)